MQFSPIHDRVILEMITVEQKTESGLVLATTDDREADTVYAKVIAAGPGKKDQPMTVKEGDIVILRPNMALKHQYMGKVYWIIREGEISSIVHGVEPSQYAELDPARLRADGIKELESLL